MKTLITLPTLLALSSLTTFAAADTIELYRARIDNTGAIKANGDGTFTESTETRFTGVADFVLTIPDDGSSPTLSYDLRFDGVDLGGQDLDDTNDVLAIHLHDTTGVFNTAGTPHVLNLFGFPSVDDGDVDVDATASRVTGLWDDGDATSGGDPLASPGDTETLTSSLDALRAGELFVMLHTSSPDALPGTPGITVGGQIVRVPEPGSCCLLLLAVAGRAWSSRKQRCLSTRPTGRPCMRKRRQA